MACLPVSRRCESMQIHREIRFSFQSPAPKIELIIFSLASWLIPFIHSPSSPKLHEHDNSSFMSASVCANAHAQPGSCRRHARGLFLNLYFHLIAFKSSSRALSSNYFFPLFQSPHCHRRLKIFCAPKSCLPDCNLSDDTIPFFRPRSWWSRVIYWFSIMPTSRQFYPAVRLEFWSATFF